MNKFKKLGLCLALLLVSVSCKKNEVKKEAEVQVVEVEKPKPISSEINIKPMTFGSKLALDNMATSENYDLKVDPDKTYSKIEQGDFDIAVIPAFMGPYFYQKTNQGIKIAAITQTGNIYMVSDSKINGQMDYRGKNLFIPDPVGNIAKVVNSKIGPLNLFLRLKIEYYKKMAEIVEKMENTSNYVGVLSDPYYTKALRKQLYVSSVSDLLPLENDDFISEILIVNSDYLLDHKDTFDEFLDSYKEAITKIEDEPEISSKLLRDFDMTEDEIKLALERSPYTFIDGDTMKGSYGVFLDRISELDETLVGEIKPSDDFYYISE